MNRNDLHSEVIKSWKEVESIREEWDALASVATREHPFFRYDWFHFFYRLYVPSDKIRIIVLRDDAGQVRALLPGFKNTVRKLGLHVPCFSYAANGYTKYGGVIADPADTAAIQQSFLAAVNLLRPRPSMLIMPFVLNDSPTGRVISGNNLGIFANRVEHSDVVIGFSMPDGWEDYFATRSRNTRNRIKSSFARGRKLGRLKFEHFDEPWQSAECVERLRRVDALTWQGQQGTGLFSTPENERFYNELLSFKYPGLALRIYFTVIDGQDVAYCITASGASTRIILKQGYDPAFSSCSPGVLTMVHVCKSTVEEGILQMDYGIGDIGDKRQWETERQKIVNWWLINRNCLRGRLMEWIVKVHDKRPRKRL